MPPREIHGELAELAGTGALLARAKRHLDAGRPLHALHFIDIVLGAAPEHVAGLQLYRETHERLLAESTDVNNAYEQNYLQSVINETEAALEELRRERADPGRGLPSAWTGAAGSRALRD